jgi:hypothetical protein
LEPFAWTRGQGEGKSPRIRVQLVPRIHEPLARFSWQVNPPEKCSGIRPSKIILQKKIGKVFGQIYIQISFADLRDDTTDLV